MATTKVTTGGITDATIATADIADQAVALSKLPHGDGSSDGKFLRANNGADPSFETVSIPAGTTINNNADNRVITGSGTANTLNGESGLSYDGSVLQINGDGQFTGNDGTANQLKWDKSEDSLYFRDNVKSQFGTGGDLKIYHNGSNSYIDSQTGSFYIRDTGGAERVRINGYGTAITGGLLFGTDTAAANALDDYEEGTWTPTINVGTFSVFVTCKYVKIGRFVKVNGGLIFNNTTSSTEVQISGLPFAGDGSQFTGTVWLRRTSTGDKKYISTIGQSGNSTISYQHDSNGNDMGGAIAYSNFQNSATYNNFSISYFTNS